MFGWIFIVSRQTCDIHVPRKGGFGACNKIIPLLYCFHNFLKIKIIKLTVDDVYKQYTRENDIWCMCLSKFYDHVLKHFVISAEKSL